MKEDFLYVHVYEELKKKISQRIWEEGSKMPPSDELTREFGVSMITVKKALSMLKDEGILQRIPGVGTFVKSRNPVLNEESVRNHDLPKKIGLVMEHVSSSFGLQLLYRIDTDAEAKGYKTLTRFSYYSREKETDEIDFLVDSRIAGLIVMPCHGLYYNPKLLKLILEGFPVVVVDKKLEGISVPSVRTDNKQAVKSLVKHLWEQGCRRIGFVSFEIVGTSSLQNRRSGFYEAVGEYGLESLPECILTFNEDAYGPAADAENVEKAVKYLKENRGKIDGLICAEYILVPVLTEAAKRTAAKIGEDIKICCVDGPEENIITHMKQNEVEIADKVMELLLAQIDGAKTEGDILIPAVLVEKQ